MQPLRGARQTPPSSPDEGCLGSESNIDNVNIATMQCSARPTEPSLRQAEALAARAVHLWAFQNLSMIWSLTDELGRPLRGGLLHFLRLCLIANNTN